MTFPTLYFRQARSQTRPTKPEDRHEEQTGAKSTERPRMSSQEETPLSISGRSDPGARKGKRKTEGGTH